MNQATAAVCEDMVLGELAKKILGQLVQSEPACLYMLVAVYKMAGGKRMADEYEEGFAQALAPEMNLVRHALASCGVPAARQEEVVGNSVRRVVTLFVGFVHRLSNGEPIDEEHAEFLKNQEIVAAAKTPADKLRVIADMLEKRASGAPSPVKLTNFGGVKYAS